MWCKSNPKPWPHSAEKPTDPACGIRRKRAGAGREGLDDAGAREGGGWGGAEQEGGGGVGWRWDLSGAGSKERRIQRGGQLLHHYQGVNFGRRLPRRRGQYSTPIHSRKGALGFRGAPIAVDTLPDTREGQRHFRLGENGFRGIVPGCRGLLPVMPASFSPCWENDILSFPHSANENISFAPCLSG